MQTHKSLFTRMNTFNCHNGLL